MAYETVLYEVVDRICTITLNRPEKLNAWTRQMHLDLRDAMQNAGADENVRAIILTGAGWSQGSVGHDVIGLAIGTLAALSVGFAMLNLALRRAEQRGGIGVVV